MDRIGFEKGYAAYRAGNWDEACECFYCYDARSKIALAYVLMNRGDSRRDTVKAFEIFSDLAAHDDPIACTDLGFLLYYGIGCRANNELAADCYRKAADMGFPRAVNNLAVCLIWGSGVKPDPQKAIDLLLGIAGDTDQMVLSNLGSAYQALGNTKQAKLWFRRAAALGDPKAIDNLREFGEDVTQFTPTEPDFDEVLFGELLSDL